MSETPGEATGDDQQTPAQTQLFVALHASAMPVAERNAAMASAAASARADSAPDKCAAVKSQDGKDEVLTVAAVPQTARFRRLRRSPRNVGSKDQQGDDCPTQHLDLLSSSYTASFSSSSSSSSSMPGHSASVSLPRFISSNGEDIASKASLWINRDAQCQQLLQLLQEQYVLLLRAPPSSGKTSLASLFMSTSQLSNSTEAAYIVSRCYNGIWGMISVHSSRILNN